MAGETLSMGFFINALQLFADMSRHVAGILKLIAAADDDYLGIRDTRLLDQRV
jgi:hypothetical protein